jgi:hypothetical protein
MTTQGWSRRGALWAGVTSVAVLAIGVLLAVLARQDQGGKHPAFDGTWAMTPETTATAVDNCCGGAAVHVPLAPKYRAIRDAYVPQDSVNTISNLRYCISAGVPGTLQHPILFEFLFTPGRVSWIFQDGSYRRIWVDGRSFPQDIMPSAQGYSIGHWQGDTLVVETRGLSGRSEILMSGPIMATSRTRVREEISLAKDDLLRIRMSVEDPEIFTAPYVFDAYFAKVPILFDVGCASDNRDDGHTIDLSLPED